VIISLLKGNSLTNLSILVSVHLENLVLVLVEPIGIVVLGLSDFDLFSGPSLDVTILGE